MNDPKQVNPAGEQKGQGLGCLLTGIGVIVIASLGYTVVPYALYGGDRALSPWQMWGIGVTLILMSIGGAIRQMRAVGKGIILTKTLKDEEKESGAESTRPD